MGETPLERLPSYAESKFQEVLLAFAVARLFPAVKSNSLESGWVPTKMGGAGAPDDTNGVAGAPSQLAVRSLPLRASLMVSQMAETAK